MCELQLRISLLISTPVLETHFNSHKITIQVQIINGIHQFPQGEIYEV